MLNTPPKLDEAAGLASLFDDLDRGWMANGICDQTDPDAFHPEKGESALAAQRICFACPVREQCLEYAIANGETFGIWGGTTARARASLKRSRTRTVDETADVADRTDENLPDVA